MTRPLWQLSACEMREGLRARRFLATEIIESVAGRISTRNGHINAIVDDYTDQALRGLRPLTLRRLRVVQ